MKKTLLPAVAVCLFSLPAARAAPGELDPTFNPTLDMGEADTPIVQPDGRIVVGGSFTAVNGIVRRRVVRLMPDGSLDDAFDPNAGAFVRNTTLQDDGKILLGGMFSSMGGSPRSFLARVHASGALDTTFAASANNDVYCLAPQSGSGILAGGDFTSMNGTGRSHMARLLSDGTLDTTFNPAPNDLVRTIQIMSDGRILICGQFTSVGATSQGRVARLLPNGAVDPSFNAAVNGQVYCMALQPDGKIVIGGSFSAVGLFSRTNLARLMPDGTLDSSFLNIGTNAVVRSAILQTDGKILLGGEFTSVGANVRNGLARLLSTGAMDPDFAATSFGGFVFGVTLQADGGIIAGGRFTTAGGVPHTRLARLQNDAATGSLTVSGNQRIVWLRGGSSPEALQTDFHLSTDGGTTWSPLGTGSRISNGWELTGLHLPETGHIRGRARTRGAYGSAAGGLVEAVRTYTFDPLLAWRQANFGTPTATGPAANDADPDNDGLENLVEFAFGRNPNVPDASLLPAWERDDDYYVMAFTRPAGVNGIGYIVEYSPTMAPGSWTSAPNSLTAPQYAFLVPGAAPRLYLRTRVAVQ